MTRVYVVHPAELGESEIARWHRMQQATPALAHPFLSPEYATTVGAYRGQSRVAILMDGHSVIGFFPFEVRRFGLGVPISGWLSACQAVIHEPGAQWDPVAMLRGCGVAAWRFDNLIAEQEPFKPYQAEVSPSPVIDLTQGFESYYAEMRKRSTHFCRELERKTRKLSREAGELRLESDARDPAHLSRLIAWKSDQYRQTGAVDRFEHFWVTGLLHELLALQGDHLTGQLSVLYAGEHPVSIQFGLRAGGILVGWFTGYDQRFRKYSPGLLQIRMMAEALHHQGVDVIHMGKGARCSARTFKSHDIMVGVGTVTNRSVLGITHRVLGSIGRQAQHTVRVHPVLHHAADQLLRRSGASTWVYGKV